MRGSVYKRCQCRDEKGKRLKSCRKDHGSWAFTIDAGKDPTTGRRKQIVRSGFRTQKDANEALTKELAALDSGVWTDDKGITVATWLNQWLDETAERGRSPKTLAGYHRHVHAVWVPRIGHLRLRDLRRTHIERALAELAKPRADAKAKANVGRHVVSRDPATLDSYRRTLRAALAVARRRGLITINHAEGRMEAIPDKTHDTDGDEIAIWEPQETARFLEHLIGTGDRLTALYEVAAYAGLRRGEVCGIRWKDLDTDETGLTIRQTCVELTRNQALRPQDLLCVTCGGAHTGRILKRPKSKAGRRWVPLAAPARTALAAHRRAQHTEKAMFGTDYDDHDLIFCEIDGTPLRPSTITRAFTTHAHACALPVIRLHDLRHGAASLLLAGGVPIEVVQMILGHASPAVTRQVYAHLMRTTTADLVEQASTLLTQHRVSKP